MAERFLDEVAKSWKKNGGGVIVSGEGDDLKNILHHIEAQLNGGQLSSRNGSGPSGSPTAVGSTQDAVLGDTIPNGLARETGRTGLRMSAPEVESSDNSLEAKNPRRWLKIVGAFDQPRLRYNVNQKHFEPANVNSSLLPDTSHKTHLFRHRYNLIHQRLLRNESFQNSSVVNACHSSLRLLSSNTTTIQQAYKLTPIANLLGRGGSSHLLLGLLTISPTGALMLKDPTGIIGLDILHTRPVPENGAWFTPGMIVLIDGIYEEEETSARPGLDGNRGIGGTIGGKFIAFSIGGPPCERREVTLGVIGLDGDGISSAGGGFGWVDFLGVGSERATGSAMRQLESDVFGRYAAESSLEGRVRMVILGEVHLDNARVLQALKKILSLYAADKVEIAPMVFLLMGNFVRYAVMTGSGSGGSIEYKEYFDSLASVLSGYPTMLQNTTFIFVPGDNDPWASAFSAGAAAVLPRDPVPEVFTSRIKRAFTTANTEAEKTAGKKTDGEPIWSTNPTRMTLFGPTQEVVLFRDDISGRLRRNAMKFQPDRSEGGDGAENMAEDRQWRKSIAAEQVQKLCEGMDVDGVVQAAESHTPTPILKDAPISTASVDSNTARKLVKTVLDQGYLSPFPLSERPMLWDYFGALQLYPLPTALVLMDPEAPPFAVTYEGCHVMNPGPLIPMGKRGVAQWMEYDAKTRRGKQREIRF